MLRWVSAMMTKDEAKRARVDFGRASCEADDARSAERLLHGQMNKRLEFKSESERLSDIIKWAEGWQSKNLHR